MDLNRKRIPVILDTDIGGDIDDTWALALMLRSPEQDIKLVVSDTGDTAYRARIIARMLEIAGRTDLPIRIGVLLYGPSSRSVKFIFNPLAKPPKMHRISAFHVVGVKLDGDPGYEFCCLHQAGSGYGECQDRSENQHPDPRRGRVHHQSF